MSMKNIWKMMKSGLTQKKSVMRFQTNPDFPCLAKISPCEWHKSYSTSAAFSFVSAAAAAPATRCMPRMLGGSCWTCHPHSLGMFGLYPLVNIQKTMENHHF